MNKEVKVRLADEVMANVSKQAKNSSEEKKKFRKTLGTTITGISTVSSDESDNRI